jgi:hypothetical protein
VSGGTRPGWGKGDKHHVHTGPPGLSRRKSRSRGQEHEPGSGRGSAKHGNEGNESQNGNEQNGGGNHGGWNQGGGGGNHGGGNQGGGHGNRH